MLRRDRRDRDDGSGRGHHDDDGDHILWMLALKVWKDARWVWTVVVGG